MENITRDTDQLSFENCYKHILVFALLSTSGFPLFQGKTGDIITLILAMGGFVFWRKTITGRFYLLISTFCLLLLIQTLYFGSMYITTFAYQSMLIFAGAFSIATLGIDFVYIFQRLMLWFTVIALVLFIPILINFNIYNFYISKSPIHYETEVMFYNFKSVAHNIFFLNFPGDFLMLVRNSGPFWEPGAFGGFLVLSIMFNVLLDNKMFSWKNCILMLAIITTFSTTAYISILIFIMLYYYIKIKSMVMKLFTLLFGAVTFVILFFSLSFLGKKIQIEIDNIQIDVLLKGGDTRMASAYLDIKELFEKTVYLLFGRGSHPMTRIGTVDKEVLRNNGITDQLVRLGIPCFVFYVAMLKKAFEQVNQFGAQQKWIASCALITILVLAFSETYFRFNFFWALFFLSSIDLDFTNQSIKFTPDKPLMQTA
ncbi:hypothetical protein [Arcticibacter svalbardensis]|nr:hypothetical protein [Arcticibacter svalbardensis]